MTDCFGWLEERRPQEIGLLAAQGNRHLQLAATAVYGDTDVFVRGLLILCVDSADLVPWPERRAIIAPRNQFMVHRTQVFTLKPDTNFEAAVGYDVPEVQGDVRSIRGYKSIDLTRTGRTVSSRIGRTALGVRKRITVRAYSALRLVMSDTTTEGWSYGLRFRVTPSMARQASGRVWLAVTGRLAYPYVIYESDVDNATLDDPEEAHSFHYYLFFIPESVVLYNISTGQIYGSWDITQSGSTADRIATPIVPPTSENPAESINKTLATKPRILSKPEPQYTEEARQNQITGTVVLSAVFAETGQVTDIQVVKGLSHGLSERAIEAAKLIKFIPAESNGKKVPFKILLEYNFNLY